MSVRATYRVFSVAVTGETSKVKSPSQVLGHPARRCQPSAVMEMVRDLLHVTLSMVLRSWCYMRVAGDPSKVWEFSPKMLTARAAVPEGPEA